MWIFNQWVIVRINYISLLHKRLQLNGLISDLICMKNYLQPTVKKIYGSNIGTEIVFGLSKQGLLDQVIFVNAIVDKTAG